MTKRTAVTLTALSIVALTIAGCVLPSPDDPTDPGTTDPSASTSIEVDPSSTQCDLEHCDLTYDTMDKYVDTITPWIDDWVNKRWPRMNLPDVVFIPHGRGGRSGCSDGTGQDATYDDESYFYCGPDNTVYVGQDTVWLFFDETGDAGPAMGLAHEYGHHIQEQLDIPSPRTSQESIDFENQADCLSGAWIKFMNGESQLGRLDYPDDLDDIEKLLPMIASAEDDIERDHGTTAERKAAFMAGFNGDVEGCGVRRG